jgi:hypothetical protein
LAKPQCDSKVKTKDVPRLVVQTSLGFFGLLHPDEPVVLGVNALRAQTAVHPQNTLAISSFVLTMTAPSTSNNASLI